MVTLYVAAPGPGSASAAEEPKRESAAPQPPLTDSSWEQAATPTGDDAATSQEARPLEDPVGQDWIEEHRDATTASHESAGPTAARASDAHDDETARDWSYELEDTFHGPVEDPFREPASGQRPPGRLYPRTPARLRIKRLAAHPRAVIFVCLLLVVLGAHGLAGGWRRDPAGIAPLSTGERFPAVHRRELEGGTPATARAKAIPVGRRRQHRRSVKRVPHTEAQTPIEPQAGATSAPAVPQASGGPFSP